MNRILPAAGLRIGCVAAVALAMAACGDNTTEAAEAEVTADSIAAALDAQAPAPERRIAAAPADPRDAAAQSYIVYRQPAEPERYRQAAGPERAAIAAPRGGRSNLVP